MRAFLLAGLFFCHPAVSQPDPAVRFRAAGERFAAAVNAGRYADVNASLNETMQAALPPETAKGFFKALLTQWGRILKLDAPTFSSADTAIFTAHCEEGTLSISLSLDAQDHISGLLFKPHPADLPVPERNNLPLSLPFSGRWSVAWGGDTEDLNQHHNILNQRFAFDFVVTDDGGSTHKGDGKKNEDYYDYGRPIMAPGEGLVIRVIDGVPENAPGVMNPERMAGNAVFIQHGPSEVSILAHLIPGRIKVKEGQTVSRGQVIGLCGNSGNSSEPHLHYHLQNTPVFMDGTGIKVFFSKVTLGIDGRTTARMDYSPIRGDTISP